MSARAATKAAVETMETIQLSAMKMNGKYSTDESSSSLSDQGQDVADELQIYQTATQKRLAYDAMDNMKFGSFHIRAILVSGVGFFTDAYDLFIIGLVMPMLGIVYFSQVDDGGQNGTAMNGKVPADMDGVVKGAAAVGTLIGQLLFGYLADRFGRKTMYGCELIIMIVATVASAAAVNSSSFSILWFLVIARFIVGIGIGGEQFLLFMLIMNQCSYPLSAVITSELASTRHRGMMLAAVFSMQGFGIVTAAVVTITTLSCYKTAIEANPQKIDEVWRICIGVGILPAAFALYFRLTIPESPRYTIEVNQDMHQGLKDAQKVTELNNQSSQVDPLRSSQAPDSPLHNRIARRQTTKKSFREYYSHWPNLKVLLGCSIAWFCLDVGFYGTNLNQSVVLQAIGFSAINQSPFDQLYKLAVGNLVIALMGTFPGYFITVALVDRWGRLPIQFLGFSVLTLAFLILAAFYNQLLSTGIWLFLTIFTIAQLFFNFGPNQTTFIIPSEVFPTKIRSTSHGIAAASGKAGAILATYAFGPLKDVGGVNKSMPAVLGAFAVFMFAGLLATFWLPETKGVSLEDIEDRRPRLAGYEVETDPICSSV